MRRVIPILALAAALSLPTLADAGCMAVGYGGTVVESRCQYTATDDTDWVWGTGPIPLENRWKITVRRGGTDVVLAEGTGLLTDQPFAIHPMVDEKVTVDLLTGTNGPYGFISVGEYDDILGNLE